MAPEPAAVEGDVFDLAGGDLEETDATPCRRPSRAPRCAIGPPRCRARPPGRRPTGPANRTALADEALVDVVWSRAAEWGPNLMVVGAWAFAMAMLVYFLMGWLPYGLTFLLLLVGPRRGRLCCATRS